MTSIRESGAVFRRWQHTTHVREHRLLTRVWLHTRTSAGREGEGRMKGRRGPAPLRGCAYAVPGGAFSVLAIV